VVRPAPTRHQTPEARRRSLVLARIREGQGLGTLSMMVGNVNPASSAGYNRPRVGITRPSGLRSPDRETATRVACFVAISPRTTVEAA